jgi:hypothetical protein
MHFWLYKSYVWLSYWHLIDNENIASRWKQTHQGLIYNPWDQGVNGNGIISASFG